MNDIIHGMIKNLIRDGIIRGASYALISENGQTLCYEGMMGAVEPFIRRPILPDLRYDMASLTKVIGTAGRVMQLTESGRVDLNTPVADILPRFRYPEVTVGNLLLHNSGLMAEVAGKESLTKKTIVDMVYETPQIQPCGTDFLYSDTGYLLLGLIIREIDGMELEESFRQNIFEPLGMKHTSFMTAEDKRLYVPTECTAARGCICGTVHDSKAYLLGQCGSAGLFSTLGDAVRFAAACLRRDSRLFCEDTFQRMVETECFGRTYGWSKEYGSGTLYHTGFTGTSMLLDMENKAGFILLTNRIHPDRGNVEFLEQRKRINHAVCSGFSRIRDRV